MEHIDKAVEILKTAILLERKGKAFYTQVARQSESKSARKIFEMMAEEEDAHIGFLVRQFKNYADHHEFLVSETPHEEEDGHIEILTEQIKKEMAMSMLMNILLGTSSEFYSKLLQDKLINQSFYVNVTYEKNAENIMIYAESKHIKKLKRVLIELLTETGKDVLTESAFLRYKKVYLGQFIYALNSLETKAAN